MKPVFERYALVRVGEQLSKKPCFHAWLWVCELSLKAVVGRSTSVEQSVVGSGPIDLSLMCSSAFTEDLQWLCA